MMPGSYWPKAGLDSDAFHARLPDRIKALSMAEEVVNGRIRFWHPWQMEIAHEPEPFGKPVAWMRLRRGDWEWNHALARFSHMLDLAVAFKITGRSIFIETLSAHLMDYLAARDEREAFWKNELNSAFRLLHLIKARDLLRGIDDGVTMARILKVIKIESSFLSQRIGRRVGNWEFLMCASLAVAAMILKEDPESAAWESAATARLREIVKTEILPDGTFIEQTPFYQGQVILAMLDYFLAARTNGKTLENDWVRATEAMAANLAKWSDPEGLIPPIGDSDRCPVDYILRYGETVLGSHAPWVSAAAPSALDAPSLHTWPDAGLAVARWPMGKRGEGYLLFDASGRPAARRNWHSHADDLQFLIHTGNGPFLTDPGRYTYASSYPAHPPFLKRPLAIYPRGRFKPLFNLFFPRFRENNRLDWRAHFRSTRAHNTIGQNGHNRNGYDTETSAADRVSLLPSMHQGPLMLLEALAVPANADEISLESHPRFSHRRMFMGVLPGLWLIIDWIIPSAPGQWTSSFHFGAGIAVEPDSDGLRTVDTRGGKASMQWACHGAEMDPVRVGEDWLSPEYNLKIRAATARLDLSGAAPFRVVTLVNFQDAQGTDMTQGFTIAPIEGEDPVQGAFHVGNGELNLIANPSRSRIKWEAMETDARLAVHGGRGDSSPAAFLDGTFLDVAGKRVQPTGGT